MSSKLSTSACVHFLPSPPALPPSPQPGQGLSNRAAACPDDGEKTAGPSTRHPLCPAWRPWLNLTPSGHQFRASAHLASPASPPLKPGASWPD